MPAITAASRASLKNSLPSVGDISSIFIVSRLTGRAPDCKILFNINCSSKASILVLLKPVIAGLVSAFPFRSAAIFKSVIRFSSK